VDRPGCRSDGLAGIAKALSYSHMRQLAAAHGEAGWHAHALPLPVDGVEIVSPWAASRGDMHR
jgi:hypothetical protein